MMLNFLLWKRSLATEEFTLYRNRLKGIAWYAPQIWEYTLAVCAEISSSISD